MVVLALAVTPPPVGCHCSWRMMMSQLDFSFLMRGSKNMFKLKIVKYFYNNNIKKTWNDALNVVGVVPLAARPLLIAAGGHCW